MSCLCLCLNSVSFTWHLRGKHNESIIKKVLILGYFELGRCKICSIQKIFSGSETHLCLKIIKFIVWIF